MATRVAAFFSPANWTPKAALVLRAVRERKRASAAQSCFWRTTRLTTYSRGVLDSATAMGALQLIFGPRSGCCSIV